MNTTPSHDNLAPLAFTVDVGADIHDVNVHEKGGHFGPYENPEAWTHDLRAKYRTLR